MKLNFKKTIASILAVTTILGSLSGCVFLPDEEEVLAAPSVETKDISYTTVTVEKKDLVLKDVNLATVESQNRYDMSFTEQSGTVAKLHVHVGDVVKEGDILCELDTSALDYSITEVNLHLQKAQLDKKILIEKGASQNEIARAQVEIDLIQIQLDELTKEKEGSVLYAAADGTVSSLNGIVAGNYVNEGQIVVTIIDTSSLYVKISPDDFTLYKMGTEVFFEIDDVSYAGEVFMIPSEVIVDQPVDEDPDYDVYDPEEEKKPKPVGLEFDTEHVYIKFTDTPPENCVGSLVDTVLVIDECEDVLVVANNLIKSIDGKNIVYLLKDGKKVAQNVEIGLSTASQSEITSGLQEGDIIIIR